MQKVNEFAQSMVFVTGKSVREDPFRKKRVHPKLVLVRDQFSKRVNICPDFCAK